MGSPSPGRGLAAHGTMWSTTLFEHPAPVLQWSAVVGASAVAAWTDLRSRRIPNLLTGPALLSGWAAALWVGGWPGLADSLAATVMLAAPFVVLFLFAGGGAADAKLMGALGAWLGVVLGAATLVAVCLCGIVLAIAYAAAKGRLASVLLNVSGAAKGFLAPLFTRGSTRGSLRGAAQSMPAKEGALQMPYGVAIFAGAVLAAGGAWFWRTA